MLACKTSLSVCLHWLKKSVFLTIQLIFATIHGSHYTFCYYSWIPLYYSIIF